MENNPVFLTSNWTNLSFLTFFASRKSLLPYLPNNLDFDYFNNSPVLSLVAFQFINTCFAGVKVPLYHTFTELNLRFYAKDKSNGERGVVFIKEICPYRPVAVAAKMLFNESFIVAPCSIDISQRVYNYQFGSKDTSGHVSLKLDVDSNQLRSEPESIEHFTVDRYIGYSKWHNGRTLRYFVEHTPWQIFRGSSLALRADFEYLYGKELAQILSKEAACCIFSKGSNVKLRFGKLMKDR